MIPAQLKRIQKFTVIEFRAPFILSLRGFQIVLRFRVAIDSADLFVHWACASHPCPCVLVLMRQLWSVSRLCLTWEGRGSLPELRELQGVSRNAQLPAAQGHLQRSQLKLSYSEQLLTCPTVFRSGPGSVFRRFSKDPWSGKNLCSKLYFVVRLSFLPFHPTWSRGKARGGERTSLPFHILIWRG